jgi:steroid delta-isomerase-like uncharacterized protein
MVVDLTQADAMSLATKMVDQFNRRDFDAMIAMAAREIDYTDVAFGRHITDADTFRAAMQGWVDAFSDIRGTVTSATYDGKILAYEVLWEGTHDGPLTTPMGAIPASGARLSVQDAFIVVMEGEKVAASRQYGDTLTVLGQIGAIPAQGTATEPAPAARA